MTRAKGKFVLIEMDPDTHRKLKVLAAKEDTTMKSIILNLLKEEVKRAEKM
jgi:predicted transcriptional regulator